MVLSDNTYFQPGNTMTTDEKRDELLACIQQLDDIELDQAYRLLEVAFPRLVGWDSDKLNEEIARDFYESKIFPGND